MPQPAVFGSAFYSNTAFSSGGVPAVYGQAIYGRSVYGLVDIPPELRQWRIRPLDSGWTVIPSPNPTN